MQELASRESNQQLKKRLQEKHEARYQQERQKWMGQIKELEQRLAEAMSANEGLAIELSKQDERLAEAEKRHDEDLEAARQHTIAVAAELRGKLKEAEKVIEFYADMRRWKYSGFNNLYAWIVLDDIEQVNEIDRVGGKHAREYQAKFINVAYGEAAR